MGECLGEGSSFQAVDRVCHAECGDWEATWGAVELKTELSNEASEIFAVSVEHGGIWDLISSGGGVVGDWGHGEAADGLALFCDDSFGSFGTLNLMG